MFVYEELLLLYLDLLDSDHLKNSFLNSFTINIEDLLEITKANTILVKFKSRDL